MQVNDIITTEFKIKGAKKLKKQLKKIHKRLKAIHESFDLLENQVSCASLEETKRLQLPVQSPEEVSQHKPLAYTIGVDDSKLEDPIDITKYESRIKKENEFFEFLRKFSSDLAQELDEETRNEVIKTIAKVQEKSFVNFKPRLRIVNYDK